MSKSKAKRKARLVLRCNAIAERAKALYQKKDEVFARLLKLAEPGEVITTDKGNFTVVDNFANGRNVAYRPASVHRYELKPATKVQLAAAASAAEPALSRHSEAEPDTAQEATA